MKFFFINLFFSLFISNAYAQNNFETQATEITEEMTEVLSLNEELKANVYKIQLQRFQEVASIREEYKDDPQTRKAELKKVFNRLFGKLIKALGKDNMQQWGDYKREIGRE